MIDEVSLVKEQLALVPGKKKTGSRYTMICCPFHNDRSPSGRVLHDTTRPGIGSFKCFSCSHSTSWNGLAAKLGLKKIKNLDDVVLEEMGVPKSDFEDLDSNLLGDTKNDAYKHRPERFKQYPLDAKNAKKSGLKKKEWRGYNIDWLSEVVGATLSYDTDYGNIHVRLPINVNGKERGFIRAQLFKPKEKSVPSYINSPGRWSTKYGLFLFDQSLKLMHSLQVKTIVLVEGPRDALRLLRHGIPAMAILGTHSWSDFKLRLLEMAGVTRVVLMFDGEEAGKAATKLILTGCKPNQDAPSVTPIRQMFETKVIKLWNMEIPEDLDEEKLDPGNVPESVLDRVKTKLLK